MSTIAKKSVINIYVYRAGDSAAIKTTPAEMLNEAAHFPEKVKGDNGYVFKATLMPYTNIPLPSKASIIDVQTQTELVQSLSDQRLAALQKLTDIYYVLSHPDEFIDVTPEVIDRLNGQMGKISININLLAKAASICYKDYTQCNFPTNLAAIDTLTPKRIAKTPASADEALDLAQQQKKAAEQRERDARDQLAKAQSDAASVKAQADAEIRAAEAAKAEGEKARAQAEAAKKAAQDEIDAANKAKAEAEAAQKKAKEAQLAAARAATDQAIRKAMTGPGIDIGGIHIGIGF